MTKRTSAGRAARGLQCGGFALYSGVIENKTPVGAGAIRHSVSLRSKRHVI